MNRRLLNLLARNPQSAPKATIKNEGDEATIYLYDVIDNYWGINAQDLVKEIAGITASTIHVRINSPGGNVFDARAIKTALEQHKAKVITHVDGLAASAASTIMLAGAEVEIAQGAFVMIHNAWGFAIGNAIDMRSYADLLDKVDGQIVGDYERKTKKSRDQIEQWMRDETWFTADEAVAEGFCDRVFETAAADNVFDLSAFANAPKALTERKTPEQDTESAANLRAAAERRLALYERTAA